MRISPVKYNPTAINNIKWEFFLGGIHFSGERERNGERERFDFFPSLFRSSAQKSLTLNVLETFFFFYKFLELPADDGV